MFEEYCAQLILKTFDFLYYKPLVLKDLELSEKKNRLNKNETEICDFVLIQNKKIVIGEIKSKRFNNEEKYDGKLQVKISLEDASDLDFLGFKSLVRGINYLLLKPELILESLGTKKRLKVYPVVVVQESLYHMPFINKRINKIFRKKIIKEFETRFEFEERAKMLLIENLEVYPLTFMHINCLEMSSKQIRNKKIDLWEMLSTYFQKENYTESISSLFVKKSYDHISPIDSLNLVKPIVHKYHKH